jgi:erythromycin esterase
VQWLLQHEPADRIALWGHNAHLTRGAVGGGMFGHEQETPSLGENLARLTDVDYYALGLILGGGEVRAAYAPEQDPRDYAIEEPPEGSVPEVLGRIDASLFFLDIAGLPADSIVSDWFDSKPLHYVIEGKYKDTPVTRIESNFRQQFDGLLFIEETTAAKW